MRERKKAVARLILCVALLLIAMNLNADYYTCDQICEGEYYGCLSECGTFNFFCKIGCANQFEDCATTCHSPFL